MNYDIGMSNKNNEIVKKLGKRIRMVRTRKGITQEELAEILNVSRVSIGKYESGDMEPKLKNLIAIASALEVSVDYLLGIDLQHNRVQGMSADASAALEVFMNEIITQHNDQKKKKKI